VERIFRSVNNAILYNVDYKLYFQLLKLTIK